MNREAQLEHLRAQAKQCRAKFDSAQSLLNNARDARDKAQVELLEAWLNLRPGMVITWPEGKMRAKGEYKVERIEPWCCDSFTVRAFAKLKGGGWHARSCTLYSTEALAATWEGKPEGLGRGPG